MPLFSVIIPTYDREAFVADAVRSACAQGVDGTEVLVVDDGSTDGTARVLAGLARSGLRVIRQDNAGVAAALNAGIAAARGRFVVPLGSDDLLAPGILRRYAAMLGRRPDLDVCYGDMVLTDAALNVTGIWKYPDWDGDNAGLVAGLLGNQTIAQSGTAFARALFERYGLYDPAQLRAADHEHLSRFAHAARFAHAGEPSVVVRRHEGNISRLTASFRYYKARALERVLRRQPLNALFPDEDWRGDPEGAAANAGARARAVLRAWREGGSSAA